MTRDTREEVVLLLVLIVGLFVIGSLAVIILLSVNGQQPARGVWAGLFALCTAALGAAGGYVGGQAAAAARRTQDGADFKQQNKEKP